MGFWQIIGGDFRRNVGFWSKNEVGCVELRSLGIIGKKNLLKNEPKMARNEQKLTKINKNARFLNKNWSKFYTFLKLTFC